MLDTERLIVREAFGLMPYRQHEHPQNFPEKYRRWDFYCLKQPYRLHIEVLRSFQVMRGQDVLPFFGQALLFDAVTIAVTAFAVSHFPLPDFTHNGPLHLAQNVATVYLTKGIANLPMLAIDGPLRILRGRRLRR